MLTLLAKEIPEQKISGIEIKRHIKAGCLSEEVNVDVKFVDDLATNRRG